jgi:serine/threonine protein kinase
MIFDLGCQLLDSFEALHEAGYVYNDLKPENIMVNKRKESKLDKHTS